MGNGAHIQLRRIGIVRLRHEKLSVGARGSVFGLDNLLLIVETPVAPSRILKQTYKTVHQASFSTTFLND